MIELIAVIAKVEETLGLRIGRRGVAESQGPLLRLPFLAKQEAGDWDITWGNLSRADGDVLRTQFSQATTKANIDDPELEALLQAQLAEPDAAKREAILADAQERIASQYYQIPVHELTSIVGTQVAVHGVTLGADSRLESLVGAWKDAS